jgi:hypothetical protein
MLSMRSVNRVLVLLALVSLVAACGSPAAPRPTASPASSAAASPSHAATPRPTAPPSSAASGGTTIPPAPSPTAVGKTKTPWGVILDAVPDTFPLFPDATLADPLPEAVSGAWITKASVDEVATWYHDAVLGAAFASADLGTALEDGSRVLDVQGDLPECKVQFTFRPVGGSTMITVLYGAGCAGGDS